MRAVKVYRNTEAKRFGTAKLPIHQTLIWAGPIFILVQPRGVSQ